MHRTVDTAGTDERPAPPVLVWRPEDEPTLARAVDLAAAALVGDGAEVLPLDWDDHIQTLLGDYPVLTAYEGSPAGPEPADHHDARIRRDVSRADLVRRLRDGAVVLAPVVRRRPWRVLGLPSVPVTGIRSGDDLPLGLEVIGLPGRLADLESFAARLEHRVAGAVVA